MLSEDQTLEVWNNRLSAEIYALYFAGLANRYSRQKQVITFSSFFLSSGAVVSVLGKLPSIITVLLSLAVALLTAYAVAWNLAARIRTMASSTTSGWNLEVNTAGCGITLTGMARTMSSMLSRDERGLFLSSPRRMRRTIKNDLQSAS